MDSVKSLSSMDDMNSVGGMGGMIALKLSKVYQDGKEEGESDQRGKMGWHGEVRSCGCLAIPHVLSIR